MVDHKGEVDHEACRVALAVGAGVRLVGWQAVVCEEFVLALAVDDDATACALHLRGEVNPATNIVKCLILKRVRINRERKWRGRSVGVLGVFLAALQACRECY